VGILTEQVRISLLVLRVIIARLAMKFPVKSVTNVQTLAWGSRLLANQGRSKQILVKKPARLVPLGNTVIYTDRLMFLVIVWTASVVPKVQNLHRKICASQVNTAVLIILSVSLVTTERFRIMLKICARPVQTERIPILSLDTQNVRFA